MDRVIAERMAADLAHSEIAGWQVEEVAGYGKSAVVFKATKSGSSAAVKVFDPEMVKRFGQVAQQERVYRERSLVGKHHPHLVAILDAGWDDNKKLFFVVMEYVQGKTLADVVATLPRERIFPLLSQIASAAQFLDSLGVAHRDIKPENIAVSDDLSIARLLDLGVVRPIGLGNITDQGDRKKFVGTLRYSPPELLVREEQDTIEGWRGVTFYQLGGVLHDMIMRRPLFGQYEDPYAKLVDAVRREIPKMEATDVPASLRQLAANCLVKDPGTRLSLVEWASFQKAPAEANDARAAAERIAQRRKAAAAASNAVNEGYRTIRELEEEVRRDLRRIAKNVLDGDDFPPRQIEEGDASVDVEFSPSPSFALANLLRVKFSVEVVDPASKVVRVVATAFVVGKGGSQMPSGIPAKNMILEGGYSAGSVLEDSLKNYLILAFDAAQQTVEIPDDGQPEWVAVPG